MKNVLNFIMQLINLLGLGNSIKGLAPDYLDIDWKPGDKNATITIGFVNISALASEVLTVIMVWLNSHEQVITASVSGNIITITIHV
jgi:hypothetical protein